MSIIIDTENSVKVRLLYKLRDKWNFRVGGGLTVRNIYFDAVDSLITPETDTTLCLQNNLQNCCSVDVESKSITPSDVCYFREQP